MPTMGGFVPEPGVSSEPWRRASEDKCARFTFSRGWAHLARFTLPPRLGLRPLLARALGDGRAVGCSHGNRAWRFFSRARK